MLKQHKDNEGKSANGGLVRDVILGGQDGLVNVLGILLGVAKATNDNKVVIIAGLAATFAESISMAAVAYTSTKAENEFYQSELEREKREMREVPLIETEEIRQIYFDKGLRGKKLETVVKAITSNDKAWLDTMMIEELGLSKERDDPVRSSIIVGLSALGGSIIPLAPFLLLPAANAMAITLAISAGVLFAAGAIKAQFTSQDKLRSGLELAAIGMLSAIAGYAVGALMGA